MRTTVSSGLDRGMVSSYLRTCSNQQLDEFLTTAYRDYGDGRLDDDGVQFISEEVERLRRDRSGQSAFRLPEKKIGFLPFAILSARRRVAERPEQPVEQTRDLLQERGHRLGRIIGQLPSELCAELASAKLATKCMYTLLEALCRFAARDLGECVAARETLGREAACSRASVNFYLGELERKLGWIKVHSRRSKGLPSRIVITHPLLLRFRDFLRNKIFGKGGSGPVGGGGQKSRQKTESIYFNKDRRDDNRKTPIQNESDAKPFPVEGSIYFTDWRQIVIRAATGTVPDCDLVANAFRKWASGRKLSLSHPSIVQIFTKFVSQHRLQ